MKVVFLVIVLHVFNTYYSQNEYSVIDYESKRKIEFDNQIKIESEKTIVYSAYVFELEKEIDASTINSMKMELMEEGLTYCFFDEKSFKFFLIFPIEIPIENLKNCIYKQSLNFIDYTITYAIKK
jgi:hypothetical protein